MKLFKLRSTIAPSLIVGVALVITSCSMSAPADSNTAETRDEAVVIGTRIAADTLDPIQASGAQNEFYNAPIYNTLVTFDEESALVPELAESWEVSDDAKSATFKLRSGVTFHSGNPVTATDVVYTLERIQKIGTGVAAFISSFKSAEAIDETTVEVTLDGPDLDFLNAMSLIYILDSKLVSENEGSDNGQQWLANNDAGSGAYTLTDYKPGQQLSLKRSEDYFDPLENRPAVMKLRMIKDASAIRDELQTGGIDIGYEVSAQDKDLFKGDEFQTVLIPGPIQTYFNLNMDGKWTSDPKVREAIQLAYDYEGHRDTILQGRGEIATGLVAPTVPCRVELPAPHQDIERAKELVKEAGASNAKLTLAFQTGPPEQNSAGTVLQSKLEEIGLQVDVKNVTFSQYQELTADEATTPDIGIAWDFAAYPSVGPLLKRAWSSDAIGLTNATRYSNAEVDKLLENGLSSTDEATACQDFEKAQEIIAADQPSIPVANRTVEVIANDRVTGIEFRPTSQVFDASLIQLSK